MCKNFALRSKSEEKKLSQKNVQGVVRDKFYIWGTNNFKARLGLYQQSLKKRNKAKDSALAEQV